MYVCVYIYIYILGFAKIHRSSQAVIGSVPSSPLSGCRSQNTRALAQRDQETDGEVWDFPQESKV